MVSQRQDDTSECAREKERARGRRESESREASVNPTANSSG